MTSLIEARDDLRQRAAWLRELPARLESAWRACGWTGSAADALHAELDRIGVDLVASADRHERAADALAELMAQSAAGGGGQSW